MPKKMLCVANHSSLQMLSDFLPFASSPEDKNANSETQKKRKEKKTTCWIQWWIENLGQMSSFCLYELADNVWDEFSESEDHIVPHPSTKDGDQVLVVADHHKKSRLEAATVDSNTYYANKHGMQSNEETSVPIITKQDKMLQKDLLSHIPDGAFTASCESDPLKETMIASDETELLGEYLKSKNNNPVGSKFCDDDPVLGGKHCAVANDLFHYPLSHISQTENDLSFFDNGHQDKGGSDLLYYAWDNDISNFGDVDHMFRNCDATFGLESFSNADDIWFSSSHSIEGSDDALKMNSKISSSEASVLKSLEEHHDVSDLSSGHMSVGDSDKKSLFMGDKISLRVVGAVDHSSGQSPLLNSSDTKSNNWQRKQTRRQNQSAGKRRDRNMENGNQEVKQNVEPRSLNYLQTHIPYMRVDHCPSDQISACLTQSSTKSECNGHPSPIKECSYASNQIQSLESFQSPMFEASPAVDDKKENQLLWKELRPSFARNFEHTNIASPMAFNDPVLVQKQGFQSENEIEGHSEIGGVKTGMQGELNSSNAQESSFTRSVLNDISLETTSFHQLQHVVEQLDIRTKLCIRDSLYRLARSAEQRHNCTNTNGGKRDGKDTSGAMMAEETNKSSGFMDVETDTNPIDRSIAHLLFHRPSDPSVMSTSSALSPKSHVLLHGSINGSRAMVKDQVRTGETAVSADKSFVNQQ
uniref:Protein LNK1 n=1 Tax=Rhizophora mucronata TaxID=61149 RepID=A0A2P2KG95_RHIMU